jgi:poly-gamma-glutamate capsule biosynthesis protein CapA/YwtB (metallophosphatase superfamily)
MLQGAHVLALRTRERGMFFALNSKDARYDYRFHMPLRAELKVVAHIFAGHASRPACWSTRQTDIICQMLDFP